MHILIAISLRFSPLPVSVRFGAGAQNTCPGWGVVRAFDRMPLAVRCDGARAISPVHCFFFRGLLFFPGQCLGPCLSPNPAPHQQRPSSIGLPGGVQGQPRVPRHHLGGRVSWVPDSVGRGLGRAPDDAHGLS